MQIFLQFFAKVSFRAGDEGVKRLHREPETQNRDSKKKKKHEKTKFLGEKFGHVRKKL